MHRLRYLPALLICALGCVMLVGAIAYRVDHTNDPPSRQYHRPATAEEIRQHDLHQQLSLIRVCATAPAGTPECAAVSPAPRLP